MNREQHKPMVLLWCFRHALVLFVNVYMVLFVNVYMVLFVNVYMVLFVNVYMVLFVNIYKKCEECFGK